MNALPSRNNLILYTTKNNHVYVHFVNKKIKKILNKIKKKYFFIKKIRNFTEYVRNADFAPKIRDAFRIYGTVGMSVLVSRYGIVS